MPYKDPEKAKERAKARNKRWYKANTSKKLVQSKGNYSTQRSLELKAITRAKNNRTPDYPCPGACESCGDKISDEVKPKHCKPAYSDHNHDTLKWRGWLCPRCNQVEGVLKDKKRVIQVELYLLKKGETL